MLYVLRWLYSYFIDYKWAITMEICVDVKSEFDAFHSKTEPENIQVADMDILVTWKAQMYKLVSCQIFK